MLKSSPPGQPQGIDLGTVFGTSSTYDIRTSTIYVDMMLPSIELSDGSIYFSEGNPDIDILII
jgi:hypothetical protein